MRHAGSRGQAIRSASRTGSAFDHGASYAFGHRISRRPDGGADHRAASPSTSTPPVPGTRPRLARRVAETPIVVTYSKLSSLSLLTAATPRTGGGKLT